MSRLIIKNSFGYHILVTQDVFNQIMDAQAGRIQAFTFMGTFVVINETQEFAASSSSSWEFVNYETMAQPIQVEPSTKEDPALSFAVKEITRITLEPGETLFVTVHGDTTEEVLHDFHSKLVKTMGTDKIVIISGCTVDLHTVKVSSEVPHVEPKLVDTNLGE